MKFKVTHDTRFRGQDYLKDEIHDFPAIDGHAEAAKAFQMQSAGASFHPFEECEDQGLLTTAERKSKLAKEASEKAAADAADLERATIAQRLAEAKAVVEAAERDELGLLLKRVDLNEELSEADLARLDELEKKYPKAQAQ